MGPLTKGWVVLRRRWPVLMLCVIVALVGLSAYRMTEHKTYSASTELFLRAPDIKSSAGAYQGDLFSRQRAQTYTRMFGSDDLAQLVIDKLGLPLSSAELTTKVKATAVKDTVLMVVTATDSDPQRAANIANGYASVLNGYVAKIENIDDNPDIPPLVQVVTAASEKNAKPSGLPLWLMATLAALGSLSAAIAAMWFLERVDTTVRSRRQVEEVVGHKVLGALPNAGRLVDSPDVARAVSSSSAFADAALRLSINIESALQRVPKVGMPPVLAVVAARRGTGSSVVARCLAGAFTDRGRRVGLVSFGTEADLTLKNNCKSMDSADSLLDIRSVRRGSTAVTVDDAVSQLREDNDIILVDSTAFIDSIDAQIAIRASDAVLLVVKASVTRLGDLIELDHGAELLDTPVIGVVVNAAKETATVDRRYA